METVVQLEVLRPAGAGIVQRGDQVARIPAATLVTGDGRENEAVLDDNGALALKPAPTPRWS